MKHLSADLISKIADQATNEIVIARTFKQGKMKNWQTNEEMYYGGQKKLLTSRASVQLSRMQEFVHTLLSKIDNPLIFKFKKRKNSQLKRVDYLNSLRTIDADRDDWDIKDIVGKKQGIIYGRAIYAYFADSINGKYRPHLEPIDVYDFLIDPACGGIDIEQASYLGSYSVILNKKALKAGIKSGDYLKKQTEELIEGGGNIDDATPEETNKRKRTYEQSTVTSPRQQRDTNRFKFWRWCTTYEGERYYLLLTNNGACIRCEKLGDVFPTNDEYPMGMWPFWTWAAFPDLTEFWTPSYCDYVREIFMAQDVTVNQMIDNAEAINKPQRVVNTTAIENMAELKGDVDVNKVYQTVITPSIQTPILLFNLLETIQEKSSGVTSQEKGVEDVKGKVGIYKGNEAASADRFGLLNKSYSFGYKRFARLYEMGVDDNLLKKEAVEIAGPNGVEIVEITRRDIFKKGDSFGVLVEASNAEMMASEQAKDAKAAFFSRNVNNQELNKKKVTEMDAETAGFTQEQIDQMLDKSAYGNTEQLSEADADIEAILLGEDVRPYRKANNAYKQYIVDFMGNHDRKLTDEQFTRLTAYVDSLTDVIMSNEVRAMQAEVEQQLQLQQAMPQRPGAPPAPQPMQPEPQGMPTAPMMGAPQPL
jgi:hypothetical protein